MQETRTCHRRGARAVVALITAALITLVPGAARPAPAQATSTFASRPLVAASAASGQSAGSLEAAASKAGAVGRKVAMSLIALGFALASIVLVFRRDFKEAAGVFAVGLVAIVLATPAGLNMLRDTVKSLFGA